MYWGMGVREMLRIAPTVIEDDRWLVDCKAREQLQTMSKACKV